MFPETHYAKMFLEMRKEKEMFFDIYLNGYGIIDTIEAESKEEAQDIAWQIGTEWLSENLWEEESEKEEDE